MKCEIKHNYLKHFISINTNLILRFLLKEIFIITGQVLDREWDTELEKRLMRAAKKRILESIENLSMFGNGKYKYVHLIKAKIN